MRKTFAFIVLGGAAFYGFCYVTFLKKEESTRVVMQSGITQMPQVIATSTEVTTDYIASSTLHNFLATSSFAGGVSTSTIVVATDIPRVVTHIETPVTVRAVYMTSWIAGTKNAKEKMLTSVAQTKINAYIIDVKDNTGVVSWNGRIKEKDLEDLIDRLHKDNYYVIARVTAFQDPIFAKENPSEAIHKADGSVWKSKKGEAWVDPGSKKMWDYLVSLGQQSYAKGFDEINYDYIRYSTDGLNEKLVFPQSKERGTTKREEVITEFYTYLTDALHKDGIKVSGDVFGIITTSSADIPVLGQNFATALKHFDYVAPMVYPSHYAPGTFGYKNPAAYPGPVITEALIGALKIADAVASSTGQATSTERNKIRPWYQDFNMGAVYTETLVRAQIDAGKKLGIDSYMMWDPKNRYTLSAYK